DRAANVLDHRHVAKDRPALLCKQRCRDHLERRVLGALDEDGSLKGVTALDAIAGLVTAAHTLELLSLGGGTSLSRLISRALTVSGHPGIRCCCVRVSDTSRLLQYSTAGVPPGVRRCDT